MPSIGSPVDHRGHLDGRKFDDLDDLGRGDVLVSDVEAGMEDDAAVVLRPFVMAHRDARLGAGPGQVVEDLGEEPGKERAEILASVPGCGALRFGQADGFGLLDDDVVSTAWWCSLRAL